MTLMLGMMGMTIIIGDGYIRVLEIQINWWIQIELTRWSGDIAENDFMQISICGPAFEKGCPGDQIDQE